MGKAISRAQNLYNELLVVAKNANTKGIVDDATVRSYCAKRVHSAIKRANAVYTKDLSAGVSRGQLLNHESVIHASKFGNKHERLKKDAAARKVAKEEARADLAAERNKPKSEKEEAIVVLEVKRDNEKSE